MRLDLCGLTYELLSNQALKKQYDDALLKIEEKKDALLKKLKQLSGLTGRTVTPESELLKCFGGDSIFELLEAIDEAVIKTLDERLSATVYGELFNDKTIPFLESGQINTQLKEYIEKYNELLEKSPVLSKTFNHYHAKTVHKNFSDNGFFSANHSVNLFNGKEKEEITSAERFDEKIEDEKKYRSGKEVIKNAVSAAKSERTEWEKVVDLFNKRFSVPFKVVVSNQD